MTPADFIRRAVGLPWVRWRSDWQAVDCFGLVVLWHREVLGTDPGAVPHTDIATGFAQAQGWQPCDAEPYTTAFMAFDSQGPTHCGIVVPGGQVLHALGGPRFPGHGSTVVSPLRLVRRLCGDIQTFRYSPC